MLVIKGTQDIYISKGDSKSIAVNLVEKTTDRTADYEMADTEYLVLFLWDRLMRKKLKTLRSDSGTSIINIDSGFTADLLGQYAYSVDLLLSDGTKETIIGKSPSSIARFVVLEA